MNKTTTPIAQIFSPFGCATNVTAVSEPSEITAERLDHLSGCLVADFDIELVPACECCDHEPFTDTVEGISTNGDDWTLTFGSSEFDWS